MQKAKAMLLAAVAGMGLASVSQGASIVTSMELFESDGVTPIPPIAGVYYLFQSQEFKVELDVSVPDPNFTRGEAQGRPAATANKPLGVQSISAQIISSANNIVIPIGDGVNSPQHWQNSPLGDDTNTSPSSSVLVDDGNGIPFASLSAIGDSDLDVDGAGFVNNSFTTSINARSLVKVQYGAAGGNANNGPFEVAFGDYVATTKLGLTDLHTNITAAQVFADANTSGNSPSLIAVDPTAITNGSVQIDVVQFPEPANLGLLGVGAISLLERRQRNGLQ